MFRVGNHFITILSLFALLALVANADAALDGAALKQHLQETFGKDTTWSVSVLGSLKKNMSYDDVRGLHPKLPGNSIADKKIFVAKIQPENNPIVDNIELKFRSGKLYGALIHFKRNLDKDLFKQVSLEVFEGKFGKIKPDKRGSDIINKFSSDGLGAQRSWLVDHWLLEVDIP